VSNRIDAIQKQVSDMLAVEEHILEAVERQRGDDALRNNFDANKVVIEIERVLKQHVGALNTLIDEYGGRGQSAVKKAITELLGVAAGLYDKVREQKVSRMLRDDYTALSLAVMSYTAFHTFGLAVKEDRIADLALNHLKDLTPILVEISKVLPMVVAAELAAEYDFPVDGTVGAAAVGNTQTAWTSEATEKV
jgi:hypothetical protein